MRLSLLLFLLLLAAGATQAQEADELSETDQQAIRALDADLARRQESAEGTRVANTFARAVNYIFYPNFEADSVLETFSDAELQILEENPDALNSIIRAALGWQDSVGGAKLMAHFGLTQNFDYLRRTASGKCRHWLAPGWTGEAWGSCHSSLPLIPDVRRRRPFPSILGLVVPTPEGDS